MILSLRTLLLCLLAWSAAAATYYVSGSGNDGSNGLSEATAFRTIQAAANRVNPGDTVLVMNGTYTNTGTNHVVWLSRSGTANAWITFRNYPGHRPVVRYNGYGGFASWSANYIVIDGFDIIGDNDNITLDWARGAGRGNPRCVGIGINWNGQNGPFPHHIVIRNNRILKGGGGIGMIRCDYVTIENNEIGQNCWYTTWATSGISLWQNANVGTDTTSYRMIIRNNVLYDNKCLVEWSSVGYISDGNGIILDDSRNTQNGSTLGVYRGRTLVANNVVFNNGGSGIHAYIYDNADIVHNTAFRNGQVLDYGEIYAYRSGNIRIVNNIMVANANRRINWHSNQNTNVSYAANLYFGSSRIDITGSGDVVGDPRFVNATVNPAQADFRITAGSPAINSGVTWLTQSTDRFGTARPVGAGPDRGFHEFSGTTTAPPVAPTISSQPANRSVVVGATATFSITASGSAPLTYQWQRNGSPIAGATAASYTTGATVFGDSGATFRVVISNSAGSVTSASATLTVTAPVAGTGSITRQWWSTVNGFSVADIPLHQPPTGTATLTSLEGPSYWADTYGARILGYVVPPTSGAYTFWIAGDDQAELWLSPSADRAARVRIAQVPGWTQPREWGKHAAQKSAAITLTAGQSYYIEVLHKESTQGDHVAVGWARPGQATTAPSEVIPGSALKPWDGAVPLALPPGWTAGDIGGATPAGSTVFDGSTFTVRGGGADIWGTSDAFHFAPQTISGDFDVEARVVSQTNTDPWAKAGVMLRDGTAANARHVFVCVTPSNGVAVQSRASTGGSSSHLSGPRVSAPTWLRLERRGSTVTGYQSGNGSTWTRIGAVTVSIPATARLGLAVTSHRQGTLSTAIFSDVTVTPIAAQ